MCYYNFKSQFHTVTFKNNCHFCPLKRAKPWPKLEWKLLHQILTPINWTKTTFWLLLIKHKYLYYQFIIHDRKMCGFCSCYKLLMAVRTYCVAFQLINKSALCVFRQYRRLHPDHIIQRGISQSGACEGEPIPGTLNPPVRQCTLCFASTLFCFNFVYLTELLHCNAVTRSLAWSAMQTGTLLTRLHSFITSPTSIITKMM